MCRLKLEVFPFYICLQLIEMAGTLFESKIIKDEIQGKFTTVLDLYEQEMEAVNEIFESKLKQLKEIGLKVKFVIGRLFPHLILHIVRLFPLINAYQTCLEL